MLMDIQIGQNKDTDWWMERQKVLYPLTSFVCLKYIRSLKNMHKARNTSAHCLHMPGSLMTQTHAKTPDIWDCFFLSTYCICNTTTCYQNSSVSFWYDKDDCLTHKVICAVSLQLHVSQYVQSTWQATTCVSRGNNRNCARIIMF